MKSYLDFAKCKHCASRLNEVVPPEIPRRPNLILVGESPGSEEREQKRPFVGESGQLLRAIVRDTSARPVYINARTTWGPGKPTADELKIEREAHLVPLIESLPGVPVVALGQYAAMALLGGKQNEKKRAGEVLWLYDRPVVFTFHPAYYLWSGYDERILEHIAVHIKSALLPIEKPKYFTNRITKFLDNPELVVDVETDTDDYPWYGSGIVVLGVLPVGGVAHEFVVPADSAKWTKGATAAKLREILSGERTIIGHNLMFDLVHVQHLLGIDTRQASYHDTMIHLKNQGVEHLSLGLKFWAKRLLNFPPYEGKFHSVLRDKIPVRDMNMIDLQDYNARDLYATEQLYLLQKNDQPGLFGMDMEYMHYVRQMTANGLAISPSKLVVYGRDLQREKDRAENKVRRAYHLGKDFNFNSPKQIGSLLAQLGLDLPDTNKQTLLDHLEDHPFIEQLVDIRKVNKAIGKVKEMKEKTTDEKLIHSKVSVHGTDTARLSSKEPNIENLDKPMKDVIRTRF